MLAHILTNLNSFPFNLRKDLGLVTVCVECWFRIWHLGTYFLCLVQNYHRKLGTVLFVGLVRASSDGLIDVLMC